MLKGKTTDVFQNIPKIAPLFRFDVLLAHVFDAVARCKGMAFLQINLRKTRCKPS